MSFPVESCPCLSVLSFLPIDLSIDPSDNTRSSDTLNCILSFFAIYIRFSTSINLNLCCILGRYKTLEKMHEATVDRFREYGPIYKENIAGTMSVHIIEPSDVQQLFRSDGKTPGRILMEPMYHYRLRKNRNVGLANL